MQYDYEYEWDKEYCYPNSSVLINKMNIKTHDELIAAEREITSLKIAIAKSQPIKGNFDLEHLKKIHKFIFEDIYSWAGCLRHVNISKGNQFCLANNAGYSVDFSNVSAKEMVVASAESFACEYDKINEMFDRITKKL